MKILLFFTIVGLFGLLILYAFYRFDCTRCQKRAERKGKAWKPLPLRILYAVLGTVGTAFYAYTVFCMIDYVATDQYKACNENARNLARCAEAYRDACKGAGEELPEGLFGTYSPEDPQTDDSFEAYLNENFTDWYHECPFSYAIRWDELGEVDYVLYSHSDITPGKLYQYPGASRSEQIRMYLFHPEETVGCYPLREG